MAVDKKRLAAKQELYDGIMKDRGLVSPISVAADPLAEFSLTEAQQEIELLEKLSKAWKLSFCQGVVSGKQSFYAAYDDTGTVKALVRPEKFYVNLNHARALTFWADSIFTGLALGDQYGVPFVVVVEALDGRYALNFDKEPDHAAHLRVRVGGRPDKGVAYAKALGLTVELDRDWWQKIGGQK